MATAILGAKQSPRFEDGVLRWYDGDTFEIDWEIALSSVDGDGNEEDYSFKTGDKLAFEFYNSRLAKVRSVEFDGSKMTVSGGTAKVTLPFGSEDTKLFPVGSYTYCIKAITENGKRVTTIGANNKAVVERCH